MSLIYNPTFKELEQSLGTYAAINIMAKQTREIAMSLGNRITDSDALSFVARGELPDPKDYPDHRLDRVKEYLTYIDDIAIKSAVLSSYEESLLKDNLVYRYNTIEDEPRQSKVRVIMNILWDSRPHKDR
jgi:hypothetical protein